MKHLILLTLLFGSFWLSAQVEDETALTLRYGPSRTTARLALTTLDVDFEEAAYSIVDREMRWMRGNAIGLDLRHNATGRIILGVSADYFSFADDRFDYATLPDAAGRLPVSLAARNRFWSITGTAGANFRVTPETVKLDFQVGAGYQYTLYRHEYASYLRINDFAANRLQVVEEDREAISSNREGGYVSGRIAFPLFPGLGFSLDVRYSLEQELDTFDQGLSTQAGVVVFFY